MTKENIEKLKGLKARLEQAREDSLDEKRLEAYLRAKERTQKLILTRGEYEDLVEKVLILESLSSKTLRLVKLLVREIVDDEDEFAAALIGIDGKVLRRKRIDENERSKTMLSKIAKEQNDD